MALRIDSSQNRNLYVGTSTEVAVSDGNAIVTGNVGIGTTSPTQKLHINGGAMFITDGTYGGFLGKGNGLITTASASDLGVRS